MASKASSLILCVVVLSMVANALALVQPLPVGPKLTLKVQGSIFCMSGKKVKPILGATAQVKCVALGAHGVVKPFAIVSSPTDPNGIFFVSFPSILPTGERLLRCKVFLNASPLPKCNVALKINGGISGSILNIKNSRLVNPTTRVFFINPFFFSPAL